MVERRKMSGEECLRLPASSETASRSTEGITEDAKSARAAGFGCRAALAATSKAASASDSVVRNGDGAAPRAEATAARRSARERLRCQRASSWERPGQRWRSEATSPSRQR